MGSLIAMNFSYCSSSGLDSLVWISGHEVLRSKRLRSRKRGNADQKGCLIMSMDIKRLLGAPRSSLAMALAGAGSVLVVVAAAAMPSCAQQSSWPPQRGEPMAQPWGRHRGPSDRHFMVMMVPHHEEAIAMAELALSRARHPEIRTLAQAIQISQSKENEQMRSWYRQWYGSSLPTWPAGIGWGWHRGSRMGAPMMSGSGGMAGARGTSLEALLAAPDFDRAFIEQMVPHHQMGVMMATMEFNNTERPEMRKLAAEMIRVQGDEIRAMQGWYRQWYP